MELIILLCVICIFSKIWMKSCENIENYTNLYDAYDGSTVYEKGIWNSYSHVPFHVGSYGGIGTHVLSPPTLQTHGYYAPPLNISLIKRKIRDYPHVKRAPFIIPGLTRYRDYYPVFDSNYSRLNFLLQQQAHQSRRVKRDNQREWRDN